MAVQYQGDALDATNWKRLISFRTGENGEQIEERIPTGYFERWLDAAGNIRSLKLTTGAGRPNQNDPYMIQIKAEKSAKGWLPWGKCPKTSGAHHLLPKSLQDSPSCKTSPAGYPVSAKNPCACMLALEKERKAKNAKAMEELENRHRKAEMRERELREKQIAAQTEQIAVQAEVLSEQRKTTQALVDVLEKVVGKEEKAKK